jgi:nucleoside-diphosphate-sugar epimerase
MQIQTQRSCTQVMPPIHPLRTSREDTLTLMIVSDANRHPSRPFRSAMEAYWASKALARFASLSFVQEKKPQFDIVNLLPAVVIGPDERISPTEGVDKLLQGTRAAVLAPALDGSFNSAFPYVGTPVHVADVAKAHVDAVDRDAIPGNSEFILSSDTPEGVVWDESVAATCKKFFAKEVEDRVLPLEGSLPSIRWRLDGASTEVTFGWKFRTFEDTMHEMITQYLQLKQFQLSD